MVVTPIEDDAVLGDRDTEHSTVFLGSGAYVRPLEPQLGSYSALGIEDPTFGRLEILETPQTIIFVIIQASELSNRNS